VLGCASEDDHAMLIMVGEAVGWGALGASLSALTTSYDVDSGNERVPMNHVIFMRLYHRDTSSEQEEPCNALFEIMWPW
jgi:hypothetical protein